MIDGKLIMESSNEDRLQHLRRKGMFADLIISAWAEIEFNIDQLVAREFGLFYTNPELNPEYVKIREREFRNSFQKKLDFLKKKSVIKNEEYDKIKAFKEYRNKFAHGEEWTYFIKNETHKSKKMDEALEVAQLTLEIGFR